MWSYDFVITTLDNNERYVFHVGSYLTLGNDIERVSPGGFADDVIVRVEMNLKYTDTTPIKIYRYNIQIYPSIYTNIQWIKIYRYNIPLKYTDVVSVYIWTAYCIGIFWYRYNIDQNIPIQYTVKIYTDTTSIKIYRYNMPFKYIPIQHRSKYTDTICRSNIYRYNTDQNIPIQYVVKMYTDTTQIKILYRHNIQKYRSIYTDKIPI